MMEPAKTQAEGAVAAAAVAAAAGCFTMGALTLAAAWSKGLNAMLAFYAPAGALSGEGILTVAAWLACWLLLGRVWARRSPKLRTVMSAAYAMLGLGLCLSFPPVIHLLLGR